MPLHRSFTAPAPERGIHSASPAPLRSMYYVFPSCFLIPDKYKLGFSGEFAKVSAKWT